MIYGTELVRGLVLAAPFVRDGKMSWLQRLMSLMRIAFPTLSIYMSYFPNWEPRRPRIADFDEHMAKLRSNLSEPSRRTVILRYVLQQTHREAEARLSKGIRSVVDLAALVLAQLDQPAHLVA